MAAAKRPRTPPRDIIGDVEGCYHELLELIEKLGYVIVLSKDPLPRVMYARAPARRKLVFAGDLVNRGPHPELVINLVMQLVRKRLAIVVIGNQEKKYLRYLSGRTTNPHPEVRITIDGVLKHGLDFQNRVQQFLLALPFKYETDRLIVVHGAYRQFVDEATAERLALLGEIDGTLDHRGQPVRHEKWEHDYRGGKTIVHGHVARHEIQRRDLPDGGRIFNIDTRAAFGGKLSALRFPTLQIHQVQSRAKYAKPWD